MNFLYAKELKRRFKCFGHFYELRLGNGDRVKCRSTLEIVDSSIPLEAVSSLSDETPDAVVIMMNPGSSRPMIKNHVDEEICYDQSVSASSKRLVLTQPDNTQYQVMRVAIVKGWKHVRILNLSDLRDPKSESFIERTRELSKIEGGDTHSLFCAERTFERLRALKRKSNSSIILGWGQNPALIPLAEKCMKLIEGEPTLRVPSDVHPLLNAHPSPMLQSKKLEWLDTISELL